MCAPDAPPPPDYEAAAEAQGEANTEAAIVSGYLQNPNFTNPYGSREVTYNPEDAYTTETGQTIYRPQITDTLSPAEQAKLDANNQLALSLLGTAQTGLTNVNNVLSTPYDSSQLPQITTPMGPEGLQVVSDALLARLEPQMERQRELLRAQSINQGFNLGSEGYDQSMDEFNRSRNDARLAALAQAINAQQASYGMESDARNKALQEQMYLRQLPLTELNSLRTGNQPSLPQFQQYQGTATQAAPLFNAAQAQYQAELGAYNAEAAGANNLTSGLFSLGSSAFMSPWFMSSDRRLKQNIKRVGTHDTLGVGIYSFQYLDGRPAVGVMADEVEAVKPEAVMTDDEGFKMVDYSQI